MFDPTSSTTFIAPDSPTAHDVSEPSRPTRTSSDGRAAEICVLGLGYVGLPTAALFASHGRQVVGVDIDPKRVERVLHARDADGLDELEPGLRELVAGAVDSGRLTARVQPTPAEVFVLAVPTPVTRADPASDPRPDLEALLAACESLVDVLQPGNLVIVESTCPPGTTAGVVARVLGSGGLQPGIDFDLAYCPERMLPGKALAELVSNPRTIGGVTRASAERAAALYRSFSSGPIALTDCLTAEVVKLAENTFRDVNIALANELSQVCERLGIDVQEVIARANEHPRVALHRPGVGVGGHCVSVDPWFLVHAAPGRTSLMRSARRVNDAQPEWAAARVAEALAALAPREAGTRPRVAVLGVAYKPDVSDTRETPVATLLETLERLRPDAELRVHDPLVSEPWARPLLALEDAVRDADLVVVTVAHERLLALDPQRIAPLLRARNVFDLTGAVELGGWLDAGFAVRRL